MGVNICLGLCYNRGMTKKKTWNELTASDGLILSDNLYQLTDEAILKAVRILETEKRDAIFTIISKDRQIEDRDVKIENLKSLWETERLRLTDENHKLKERLKDLEARAEKQFIDEIF